MRIHIKPPARRAVFHWILFTLTLTAVSWFVARDFKAVSRYYLSLDVSIVAIPFGAVLTAHLVRFAVWVRLSVALSLSAPVLRAGRAYYLSVLRHYIPGKVSLALVRVEAYRGYPAEKVVMAKVIELIAALGASFLLACIGFASSPVYFSPYMRWAPLFGMPCCSVSPAFAVDGQQDTQAGR